MSLVTDVSVRPSSSAMSYVKPRTVRFLIILGVVQAAGLAAYLSFLLGTVYAVGGEARISIREFGEATGEFWLMWLVVPAICLSCFYALERV